MWAPVRIAEHTGTAQKGQLLDAERGCVTLQGGKCNFNLRTLGILNLLALGPLGPGLDFGIWELAKV